MIIFPKIISRRFPVKPMFLVVLDRPIIYRGFNGKMLIESITKEVVVSNLTAHQNISDDVLVNDAIKSVEWIDFFL